MLRLLRRRPLHVISVVVMVLALGAITAASAAGLKLVEPQAQSYPISMLSVLQADYSPWGDTNPRKRRLDPAIIAEAARDEATRNVTPRPGDSALVPLDLPPLPQAAVLNGQPIAQAATPTTDGGPLSPPPTTDDRRPTTDGRRPTSVPPTADGRRPTTESASPAPAPSSEPASPVPAPSSEPASPVPAPPASPEPAATSCRPSLRRRSPRPSPCAVD